MTLTISASTAAQAKQLKQVKPDVSDIADQLWSDSERSLPLAHLALARVAKLAEQHDFAVARPVDLQDLPGYEFEQYCIQIKAFRFSESLWRQAQARYGLTFATQLCHMLGAFTHSAAGRQAYETFISDRNQVLCQVKGATDC